MKGAENTSAKALRKNGDQTKDEQEEILLVAELIDPKTREPGGRSDLEAALSIYDLQGSFASFKMTHPAGWRLELFQRNYTHS